MLDDKANGYEPEALINFIALMGWRHQPPSSSPGSTDSIESTHEGNVDVLTMDDLIGTVRHHLSSASQLFSRSGVDENTACLFLQMAVRPLQVESSTIEHVRR